jgi:AmiR/NasT family two-component response regulator
VTGTPLTGIPLAGASGAEGRQTGTDGAARLEGARVVLADDDPLTRLDLRHSLEGLGVRVLGEAEDGRQALALARSLRPDLLLLDIMMPLVDGLEAARVARDEHLAAVVLLTGYAEEDMVQKADDAGVLAYLRKPFRPEDLGPALALALGRHRERLALEAQIEDLQGKMEARKLVGRAKALLMERHGLSEREAFYRIQAQSQTLQKPAHEIARAIITASEMGV